MRHKTSRLAAIQSIVIKAFTFACVFSIWMMTLLVFAGAIERNLLGSNFLLNASELLGYLMLILFSFGLSVTLAKGGHVTIDIIYRWFPKTVQRYCEPVFHLMGVFGSLAMAAGGLVLVLDSHFRGRISSTWFEVPLFIPQSLIVIGGVAFAAQFLSDMFRDRDKTAETEIGQNTSASTGGSVFTIDRSD